ncbi:MAG: hypothetical protein ACJ8F7_17130 [Gemmataceae bacterium]
MTDLPDDYIFVDDLDDRLPARTVVALRRRALYVHGALAVVASAGLDDLLLMIEREARNE